MGVFLGPLGGLREVGEVQAGVQVSSSRPSSERVTLDGRRIIQRAPRASRSWALSLGSWRDPSVAAYMSSCASGVFPGPLYLLTAHAAATNMLPANVAAPGAMGLHGLLTSAGLFPAVGTVPVHVAGQGVVPSVGVVQSASAGAWSKTVPVRQVPLVLSAWASAAGAAIEWRTVNAAGGVAQSGGTVSAAAVAGGFRGEVAITPSATAVGVQVRLAAGSRVVGGVRLVEGVTRGSGPVVATNLATNPSFEATSGTVEVRRNYFSNPRGAVGTGWPAAGTSSTVTFAEPGALVTHTSGAASGNAFVRVPLTGLAPSTTYSVRYEVTQVTGTVDLAGRVVDAFTTIQGATITKSGSQIVLTATFTTGATLPAAPSLLVEFLGAGAGEQFRVVGGVCEAGVALPGNFDGSASPDSDLTASWTGAANASPSVLTAPGAAGAGISADRARAYSSTRWASHGTRSVRISPRSSDPGLTFVETSVPGFTVGKTYTILGAIRLAAPQTGTLSTLADRPARGFWVVNGPTNPTLTHLKTAPNEAGVHEVRATFVATATTHGVRLMNGAALGGSDVWWDDLLIVEGEYTGPWFDGANNPDPSRFIVAFTGPVNGSTSTLREIPADAASEDWHPGEGVPMVVVRDPSQTMQLALPGNHRSDYAVTIEEVG